MGGPFLFIQTAEVNSAVCKVLSPTKRLYAWTLVIVLVSLVFEKVFLILLKWGERTLERM